MKLEVKRLKTWKLFWGCFYRINQVQVNASLLGLLSLPLAFGVMLRNFQMGASADWSLLALIIVTVGPLVLWGLAYDVPTALVQVEVHDFCRDAKQRTPVLVVRVRGVQGIDPMAAGPFRQMGGQMLRLTVAGTMMMGEAALQEYLTRWPQLELVECRRHVWFFSTGRLWRYGSVELIGAV